jgi:hypothetical protein
MKYNDLVQLFFERSNALQTFWTIWVAVVGAFLAFAVAREKPGLWMTIFLTVGFSIFAYVNRLGMEDVSVQRLAAMNAIKAYPLPDRDENKDERKALESVRKTIEDSLSPPGVEDVKNYHLLVDVLVLAILWGIYFGKDPGRSALAAFWNKYRDKLFGKKAAS